MTLKKKLALLFLASSCSLIFAASGFKKGAKLYVSVKVSELK